MPTRKNEQTSYIKNRIESNQVKICAKKTNHIEPIESNQIKSNYQIEANQIKPIKITIKHAHLRRGADGADACVALDGELEVGQGKPLEGEQLPADAGVGSLHEGLDVRAGTVGRKGEQGQEYTGYIGC